MKIKLVLGLVLIATFVLVSNLHSSSRNYTPTGYCHYVPNLGICDKTTNGVVGYGVFADCTFME